MSAVTVQLTDANFEQEVLKSGAAYLVDFWAEWCGPCKMIAPMVDELATEFQGQLKVGKLNVDHNPQTAVKYGIRSIPTLLFFKNGQLKDQIVGAVPKATLIKRINSILA